jgi:Ser/Thr protein kinase RdoA (MazF antagonist)
MTLWEFVPHGEHALDARELGRSLRELHAALADFPGDLPPLSGIRDWLAELRPAPALARRLEELTPAVWESSLPAQALHGDVSLGNVLRTGRGLRWNDLEDVCLGPVAWDVAGLIASARGRGKGEEFLDELLAGYGEPVEGLEAFLEAHALYEAIWRAFSRP